jgi:putative oxidoreductase
MRMREWFTNPPVDGPAAIVWLRLMTGGVFFWEGLLKFVYPNQGVGRFTKLGIPFPVFSAHAIATFEIVGGALLMLGLFTRLVSTTFILEMIVAILTTKISLFLGTSPLPLPPSPPQVGFWAVLHEIRSDYAQLLTCVFYCAAGPGVLSLDRVLFQKQRIERAVALG